jgi:hypothetical protein
VKYPVHASLPAWHVWSDGRAFSPGETKRFRKMWKRCRFSGECPRAFFERAREVVEGYMKHAELAARLARAEEKGGPIE